MLGAEAFVTEPYFLYGEETNVNCNNADKIILLIFIKTKTTVSWYCNGNTLNSFVRGRFVSSS